MGKDNLGERMKQYEAVETKKRFNPLYPVYARLDGKSFSRFTKHMKRPYDADMSSCMVETTKKLVEHTNASVGYTQSDEISLAWCSDNGETQMYFDGRIQKLVSVLAGLATSYFTLEALKYWPDEVTEKNPVFDSRVLQMPSKTEVANMVLWREMDATKNAVSMAAHHYFGHTELQGMGRDDMVQKLFDDADVTFGDYPRAFRHGTFIQRRQVMKTLDADELAMIPEKHRPTGPVTRTKIMQLDMPPFKEVSNRPHILFYGEDPII